MLEISPTYHNDEMLLYNYICRILILLESLNDLEIEHYIANTTLIRKKGFILKYYRV